MSELEIYPIENGLPRRMYAAESPIDFATWIDLAQTMDTELHRGVMIDKMAAQYPHEWIFAWLMQVVGMYVTACKMGQVLGSRTAVKITANDGRLPDILFVRADNTDIIKKDAIYGAPDLVIEIVSPNDRPSDLIPLEADYRSIGISEIVFVDPQKKRVRYLCKNGANYSDATISTGQLTFVGVPGFVIEVEWLFADNQPDAFVVFSGLMDARK